jgi:acyl carrier protein
MELDEFEALARGFLADCWADGRPGEAPPQVSVDDDLFEVGALDSLLVVELLVRLEETLAVTIDVTEIADLRTFFTIRGMWEGLRSLGLPLSAPR